MNKIISFFLCTLPVLIVFLTTLPSHSASTEFPDTRIGGYMQLYGLYQHQEDIQPTEENWGYRLRRARLTAQSSITDRLSASAWLEFAGRQNILLDFHFDYRVYRGIRIRGGQFRPFGQSFNTGILGSASVLFPERSAITPFNASQMGYDAFRDIGAMMYGSVGSLSYAFQATNGSGRFTHAGSQITSRSLAGGAYGGRLDYSPTPEFLIGGHLATNQQRNVVRDGAGPFDVNRHSASLRLQTQELLNPSGFTRSEFIIGSRDDTQEFNYDGLYVETGVNLTEPWSLLGRFDYLAQRYADDRSDDVQFGYSLGVLRYIFLNNREVIRTGIHYNLTDLSDDRLQHTVTAVFQVRFLP